MENKNKFKILALLFLTISLVFLIPFEISNIYAVDTPASTTVVKRDDIKNACSVTPPINVKSSLILSIVTLCIPGILEKIKQWQDIKCEQVVCTYEAVKNSLDPTFCKKESAYKTCTYVVGEIFAIPPMNILESLRNEVAKWLANPVGMAYGVAVIFARKKVNACVAAGSCSAPIDGAAVIFTGITDIAAAIQTFQEIMENGFFPKGSDEDYCSQVEDIAKEMEEILKANK